MRCRTCTSTALVVPLRGDRLWSLAPCFRRRRVVAGILSAMCLTASRTTARSSRHNQSSNVAIRRRRRAATASASGAPITARQCTTTPSARFSSRQKRREEEATSPSRRPAGMHRLLPHRWMTAVSHSRLSRRLFLPAVISTAKRAIHLGGGGAVKGPTVDTLTSVGQIGR